MSNVNDMARDSFVFYRSFKDSIKNLSDKERLIMYEAISDFALDMKEPNLSGFPKSLFTLIRPLLEANIRRWRNGCKGGAPLGNSNNPNGRRGKTNQELTKNKANKDVNVNVDVEYNKRESKKEKSEFSLSRSRTAYADCDNRLREWFEKGNAPYIYKNFEHLISSDELAKLKKEYTTKLICDTILAIENRSDLRKKYKNLYRTLINWLRKEARNG